MDSMNKENPIMRVIRADIKFLENIVNSDAMFTKKFEVVPSKNIYESGMYEFNVNGYNLWLGTLEEINAALKVMCRYSEYIEELI